ncbi:MAG TPA: excinuclease ABC subunit UvrB [Candidatus Moranbacteria bacterium]|nr:excinuclease ABC subunit UvrB [Candidatus Moranbacteria bacterium]HRY28024.1 excinuclease ABC subunit UvrB [Candidatus Moranbacteria bacterium]HSA07901.1 excinuclease ABC subunit UvrB [Candidatus Moranbacteria bacterium]
MKFKLSSKFKPAGDQPQAIEKLVEGIKRGQKFQTLLGVTGSGKTFTIANVIQKVQKPTLVIAPNKTLAAQLVQELRTFFPKNAVEYFVSYYDYYQPEAYLAASDTYIEKEAQINDEIDRLRHAATSALLSRSDVIIVASVSCIYGLGSPEYYRDISFEIALGDEFKREEKMKELLELQFQRSDLLSRGKFRVTGDTFEIMPTGREVVTRIEMKNGKVDRIQEYDFLTGENLGNLEKTLIYPAKHFVVPEPVMQEALDKIEKELRERVAELKKKNKLLEAERLGRRTKQDLEMMREIGYCNGIENYSRYLTERKSGEMPYTLMDYFLASTRGNDRSSTRSGGRDFLLVIDESHVTVPQLNAMYNGDRARKESLVENGFRLPSAFDNRPLKFAEFEKHIQQLIFTSATPGPYEYDKSQDTNNKQQTNYKSQIINKPKNTKYKIRDTKYNIVEQIIRPTGLLDPELVVKSAKGQVKDVLSEIEKVIERKEPARNATLLNKNNEVVGSKKQTKESTNEMQHSVAGGRVLITTLTKKMAEDLSDFLKEHKIKCEYVHSDVETLDRIRILEGLRRGQFDVLVGVNLLREGLDLPEVSLVAVLDADKEGFLRSETSLIQTIGRAARNVSGRVILYADSITGSMRRAIDETNRRRKIQAQYNQKHRITPTTIKKNIKSIVDHEINPMPAPDFTRLESLEDIAGYIKQKEREMKDASRALQFERAAIIRDEISQLRKLQIK